MKALAFLAAKASAAAKAYMRWKRVMTKVPIDGSCVVSDDGSAAL